MLKTVAPLAAQTCGVINAQVDHIRGRMMHRMWATGLLVGMGGLAGACASSSEKIAPQYISQTQYQSYSCAQLSDEAQRISGRVAHLSGAQDQKATNDAIATGVAIVVFWPAAFFIGGNDQTTAELGRLKGEFDAIEKVSVHKACGHQFRQQEAPARAKKREPSV